MRSPPSRVSHLDKSPLMTIVADNVAAVRT